MFGKLKSTTQFNPKSFELRIPGVPHGDKDVGLHLSQWTYGFGKTDLLTEDQKKNIDDCNETFNLTLDLTKVKILVGKPSNDEATGVHGYVGVTFNEKKSRAEYDRSLKVYGGQEPKGFIPHVSICGWRIKGFESNTLARRCYGLTTSDSELYPDGYSWYRNNDKFPELGMHELPEDISDEDPKLQEWLYCTCPAFHVRKGDPWRKRLARVESQSASKRQRSSTAESSGAGKRARVPTLTRGSGSGSAREDDAGASSETAEFTGLLDATDSPAY